MAKQYNAPPPQVIDPAKRYTATFKTEHGDIEGCIGPRECFAGRQRRRERVKFVTRHGRADDTDRGR